MTAHLVQLLLPLRTRTGDAVPAEHVDGVRRTLTERFGGVTAYTRAPARGAWRSPAGEVERDDVIMVEVVVRELDRAWWERYRRELERTFGQDEIHARALAMEEL